MKFAITVQMEFFNWRCGSPCGERRLLVTNYFHYKNVLRKPGEVDLATETPFRVKLIGKVMSDWPLWWVMEKAPVCWGQPPCSCVKNTPWCNSDIWGWPLRTRPEVPGNLVRSKYKYYMGNIPGYLYLPETKSCSSIAEMYECKRIPVSLTNNQRANRKECLSTVAWFGFVNHTSSASISILSHLSAFMTESNFTWWALPGSFCFWMLCLQEWSLKTLDTSRIQSSEVKRQWTELDSCSQWPRRSVMRSLTLQDNIARQYVATTYIFLISLR